MVEEFVIPTSAEEPSAPSRLCMEVIEDRWAKQTGGSASQFEDAIRTQLHAEGKSREELNQLYEDAIKSREIKEKGVAQGLEIFNKAIEAWHCR